MDVPVSVSVGVETCFGEEMDTETLMQHADAALDRAKKRGRNRFEVYAAWPDENFQEREQGNAEAVVPKR